MQQTAEQSRAFSQDNLIEWITGVVSDVLEVPASALDQHVHLARFGLDSVAAVAITTALTDGTGFELDESLLLEYPTISQLAQHIGQIADSVGDGIPACEKGKSFRTLMLEDAVLPADIQPPGGSATPVPGSILLTGATGFLGVHLLDVLLRATDAIIYCLVRSSSQAAASDRLAGVLSDSRVEAPEFENRVIVLDGDLTQPHLGLSESTLEHLAGTLDSVYHCAADVNWGLDYFGLRDSNVRPVVELLRFCCRKREKSFVFVSSISTCYAFQGSKTVTENDASISILDGIFLGYAQSKVVAETLCEQARSRGLQVCIHRPALILGSSASGRSNHDDLVSRVIKGCISMGCAPDLDWMLDACPVNEVAGAIVRLSSATGDPPGVTHLVHPQPRYWRELVLWMNIYGYPVKLVPYMQWVEMLAREAGAAEHPLYSLRPFFLHRISEAGNLAFAEIYQENHHGKVSATATEAVLGDGSFRYSALDSGLLERYFEQFSETGFLPAPANRRERVSRDVAEVLDRRFFTELAGKVFDSAGAGEIAVTQMETSTIESIITDLASWKFGQPSGLFRYRLETAADRQQEVFVKVKPSDGAVIDVAAMVGDLCVEGLGDLFMRFRQQIGLAGCHKREIAIYQQSDQRFLDHTPERYLLVDDDDRQRWVIAMEAITQPLFMDSSAGSPGWQEEHINCCIDGLAELHSIWLGKESGLMIQGHLANSLSAGDMEAAKPLWFAMARHADPLFEQALGDTLAKTRDTMIASVQDWWRDLETLDLTLIHNDFNPRNVAIVNRHDLPVLCAYDWELAAVGLPQRDLAEFLCFSLAPETGGTESVNYIERHRRALEHASGMALGSDSWSYGFQLALFDLGINRLPSYSFVNRIKPQKFLPRVVRTWHALLKQHCDLEIL